jgi:hypothetical protein
MVMGRSQAGSRILAPFAPAVRSVLANQTIARKKSAAQDLQSKVRHKI